MIKKHIKKIFKQSNTFPTKKSYNVTYKLVDPNININKNKPDKLMVALCCIAKNENLYIREWVEYYKNLGISKIFIYDNNELDGERFEDVIGDYIDSGFVEVIDKRGTEKGLVYDNNDLNLQGQCYLDCYNNRCKDFDWVCFFDVDEFLTFRNGYNLKSYLSDNRFENYDTIAVGWEIYSDNGLIHYDNRPVQERFTKPSIDQFHSIKSIVRTGKKPVLDYQQTIIHIFRVTGSRICRADYKKYGHSSNLFTYKSLANHNCILKHYKTKSAEEYIKRHLGRHWGTTKARSMNLLSLDDLKRIYFRFCEWSKEKEDYFNSFEKKDNIVLSENKENVEKKIHNNIDNTYLDGISICISAYKATKYIKETLNSIVAQTWFKTHDNWECIVGIDGCYETLDYIKSIMNEYNDHFSFYMMNNNQGTYVTSNTLMSKIAKYNWVLRFDSDDIIHENMIETIIENIDNKTDIIRFHLQNFPDDEYTLNDTSKINKCYISYGQICIKHIKFDRYGGYLPWKCSGDAEFLARTRRFLKQKKLDDVLFNRRITNDSLTNSTLTDSKSELRQKYGYYINNISLNIRNRNEAINKNIKTNTYYKVISYELIISLTSFPARIKFVKDVLDSIISTSINRNIYKLVIVLSLEEFPNKEKDLPIELVEYCNNKLIEIIWYEKNIRSHKKLIPTIKKYPSLPILVIDDDIIRNENWLKMFINDRRKYPEDILAMRCDDYITTDFISIHNRHNFEDGVKFEDYIYHNRPSNGAGGVLYPAYTFRDKVFYDEDLFMKLTPSSDEMWQFCFNIMNEQKIRRTSSFYDFKSIKGSQTFSLYKENKEKYTLIMKILLDYFPKYKINLTKLFNEEIKLKNENYKAVIALTSWKKRINTVHLTIENLLSYACNNYKIVLTLSIEEFPNKEKDLPPELMYLLLKNDNFEINWIYKNYKVFKKILFTMQKYQNLPIISADDDIIYKYNYLDELYNKWLDNKNYVISEGYEIKYNINNEEYKFSKGCATLYPPGCLLNATKYLNNEIINTQNDDSFYGIYFHLNNIKIIHIHNDINTLISLHNNNNSISVGVKNKEDFYNDKLIILRNIQQYKEI